MTEKKSNHYVFPKWSNKLPIFVLAGLGLLGALVVFIVYYFFSPKHYYVGYAPEQPIPFSHQIHAGELGMDCRYCHNFVGEAAHSNIPATETCMNCHKVIKKDSPNIQKIRESYADNTPIEWVKIHKLPDYVYFNHSAHINKGVSCVSCHGRVDQMDVVHQAKPLGMGWCLECHRNPEKYVRPKEFVTKLDWKADNQLELGKMLVEKHNIYPGESCNTCHR